MIESQIVARVLPSKCREAVKVLLQEVYGYEDFRNLEVYDDLFKGKEKWLSCNSWGITLCNFPFMHTPLLIYTGRTSYLPLHEMKP